MGADIGFSHALQYGKLVRLSGADAASSPISVGVFSFSQQECEQILHGCQGDFGAYRRIFPAPGGE